MKQKVKRRKDTYGLTADELESFRYFRGHCDDAKLCLAGVGKPAALRCSVQNKMDEFSFTKLNLELTELRLEAR